MCVKRLSEDLGSVIATTLNIDRGTNINILFADGKLSWIAIGHFNSTFFQLSLVTQKILDFSGKLAMLGRFSIIDDPFNLFDEFLKKIASYKGRLFKIFKLIRIFTHKAFIEEWKNINSIVGFVGQKFYKLFSNWSDFIIFSKHTNS